MNVRELIIQLQEMPSEDPVAIWSEVDEEYAEITGAFLALDGLRNKKYVEVL